MDNLFKFQEKCSIARGEMELQQDFVSAKKTEKKDELAFVIEEGEEAKQRKGGKASRLSL